MADYKPPKKAKKEKKIEKSSSPHDAGDPPDAGNKKTKGKPKLKEQGQGGNVGNQPSTMTGAGAGNAGTGQTGAAQPAREAVMTTPAMRNAAPTATVARPGPDAPGGSSFTPVNAGQAQDGGAAEDGSTTPTYPPAVEQRRTSAHAPATTETGAKKAMREIGRMHFDGRKKANVDEATSKKEDNTGTSPLSSPPAVETPPQRQPENRAQSGDAEDDAAPPVKEDAADARDSGKADEGKSDDSPSQQLRQENAGANAAGDTAIEAHELSAIQEEAEGDAQAAPEQGDQPKESAASDHGTEIQAANPTDPAPETTETAKQNAETGDAEADNEDVEEDSREAAPPPPNTRAQRKTAAASTAKNKGKGKETADTGTATATAPTGRVMTRRATAAAEADRAANNSPAGGGNTTGGSNAVPGGAGNARRGRPPTNAQTQANNRQPNAAGPAAGNPRANLGGQAQAVQNPFPNVIPAFSQALGTMLNDFQAAIDANACRCGQQGAPLANVAPANDGGDKDDEDQEEDENPDENQPPPPPTIGRKTKKPATTKTQQGADGNKKDKGGKGRGRRKRGEFDEGDGQEVDEDGEEPGNGPRVLHSDREYGVSRRARKPQRPKTKMVGEDGPYTPGRKKFMGFPLGNWCSRASDTGKVCDRDFANVVRCSFVNEKGQLCLNWAHAHEICCGVKAGEFARPGFLWTCDDTHHSSKYPSMYHCFKWKTGEGDEDEDEDEEPVDKNLDELIERNVEVKKTTSTYKKRQQSQLEMPAPKPKPVKGKQAITEPVQPMDEDMDVDGEPQRPLPASPPVKCRNPKCPKPDVLLTADDTLRCQTVETSDMGDTRRCTNVVHNSQPCYGYMGQPHKLRGDPNWWQCSRADIGGCQYEWPEDEGSGSEGEMDDVERPGQAGVDAGPEDKEGHTNGAADADASSTPQSQSSQLVFTPNNSGHDVEIMESDISTANTAAGKSSLKRGNDGEESPTKRQRVKKIVFHDSREQSARLVDG